MNISLLSNINLDSLIKRLSKNYNIYNPPGYGIWLHELANKDSDLFRSKVDFIFIIIDAEELTRNQVDLKKIQNELDSYAASMAEVSSANESITFFVSDFDLPHKRLQDIKSLRQERLIESYWYRILIDLSGKFNNFYIFDFKSLVENLGRSVFYSPKLWYLGGIKYSQRAEEVLENEINRYINAIKGKSKKCLILDLDNTLWGGIAGEDGVGGVELSSFKEGARFRDFQLRLMEMEQLGVLLTIVSKNNMDDALEIIEKHPNMVLRRNNFAAMKINWNIKAENIKELAEDLNLGVDSFVFIDDNPIERESVKALLPEVTVPDYPLDTSELTSFITKVYKDYFLRVQYTEEDKRKTSMYQQNFQRKLELRSTPSFESFLSSLKTKLYIWKARNGDIARIAQLTQKTNQFNLTTKRYTEADIIDLVNSEDCEVFMISSEDKFGDNGKVSTVIVKKENQYVAEIDTFLMSCRVMGRYMEDQIISYIEEDLRKHNFKTLKASFIKTKRNQPVENLYERLGYELVHNKDYEKQFIINLHTTPENRKAFAELIEL